MSLFDLVPVNELQVVPYSEKKKKQIYGEEILGNYLTHRIANAGQSECGKTVLLTRMLEKIVNRKFNKIYWFSPTAKKDPNVIQFIEHFYHNDDSDDDSDDDDLDESGGIEIHDSIFWEDPNDKKAIINYLDIIPGIYDEEPLILKGKEVAKCVIIFDDCPLLLKNPDTLNHITKTLR